MENSFGFLSLIPAILVIILALKTKKTLFSLLVGGYIGSVIISHWNPLVALPNMVSDFVIPAISDSWNAGTLILVTVAGGFVYLIKSSGAAKALGNSAAKHIKTRKGAQTATFLAAFAFVYTEPNFTLGVIMRPITEHLGVSRVKLAYLCDALASTIASLSPICSYGPYITGLIATQLAALALDGNPWPIYIKYLPMNFYAILSILTVLFVIRTGLDVGPMYVAEQRAIRTGKLIGSNDHPIVSENPEDFKIPENAKLSLRNFVIPLATLFITLFSIIFWTGDIVANGFVQSFLNAKITLAITCGLLTGAIAVAIMAKISNVFTLSEAFDKWVKGIVDMMEVNMILILAWTLSNVLNTMGLKAYIASIITNTGFPPALVPAIIFLFGAFISFATGSSWGTWAILIPIAFPVAHQFGLPLELSVAAVISGGLFGDHCSPLSDTTILASTASACDHIEHVRTQLPYGLTTGISAFIGFIVAGLTKIGWLGLVVALACNIVGLVILNKIAQKQIEKDPEFVQG